MTRWLACLGALGAAFVACAEPPQAHRVAIVRLTYAPATLLAAPGDTVTWVNDDLVPHTVTLGTEAGDADVIGVGDTLRRVMPARDTVRYWCRYHPGMTGAVILR